MPDGLMFMVPTKIMPTVFSPLFSLRTKMRMAAEWFHPPHIRQTSPPKTKPLPRWSNAITVSEMVDLLADPLLSGVYGGEASELSVRAVLPRFADMESKHGSLGRAMLEARKKLARKWARRRTLQRGRCSLRSKTACSRWSMPWSRAWMQAH